MAKKKAKKASWKAWAIGAAVLLGLGGILGASGDKDPEPTPEPVKAVATATPAPTPEPTPSPEPTATPYRIHGMDPQRTVYVSGSGIIHLDKNCSGMKNYTEMTLEAADAAGYQLCERCAK